jgi:geranylgeranyl diphosphate synthase type II
MVAWVRALLARTGALDYARSVAQGLAGAALFEFDQYFSAIPHSRDRRFMRGLLTWAMERSH